MWSMHGKGGGRKLQMIGYALSLFWSLGAHGLRGTKRFLKTLLFLSVSWLLKAHPFFTISQSQLSPIKLELFSRKISGETFPGHILTEHQIRRVGALQGWLFIFLQERFSKPLLVWDRGPITLQNSKISTTFYVGFPF